MSMASDSGELAYPHHEHHHHIHGDPHKRGSGLADVILGGQDGLVNVLGIILGMAAATGDNYLVIIAGLSATFAESISMAAVAYTSTLADADYYESELAREYRHVQDVPNLERNEIYDLYYHKGFRGDLLDRIVETITAKPDIWVAVMMAEEHQLTPIDRRQAMRSAVIVGISAVVGSLLPLLPFFFMPIQASMLTAVAITALALFFTGVYKARMMVGRPVRSGLEMALIGTVSALAGYLVGLLLKAPPGG
jgi:VIT1/CCC1 family predicted Fe2+/Mn2+ transporter